MIQQAQDIAKEALALPNDQRRTFLERSCAGDDALRSRVERLLTVMQNQTIVPESAQPPAPPAPRTPPDHTKDRWIGRYRVLEVIGSGAMGVVYLAEQQTPLRRIALKVIRPDVVTDALRDRFDQETRVLARLKHPSVAQIYDAGSAHVDGEDCPYFAMELVSGATIDVRARDLTLGARIEMLREVCAGVEHAHQRGVVHRDLKPGNILVDEHDRPRVLDFGVARAIDAEQTGRAELVGTLPYMSPEQLRADPDTDTRTDVYALGVILCELVAGRRPHDLSDVPRDQTASYLERTPPSALRELDPAAPRDLEAIASRALARDPEDRYPSAAALADDLGRYLKREPVDARPHSPAYVATRFAQRNTGVVVLSLIGALAIAGGVAGISWQAVEATRGWARATEEASRVRAINDFYTDMLTSADPENALGEELTVRELLDSAARSDARGLEDQPGVEAVVRLAIANTYRSLGALDDAAFQARGAIDASTRAFGPDDPSTADAVQALAVTQVERGEYDDAKELLERTIAVLSDRYGEDSIEVIAARGELARAYHQSGQSQEALELWRDCLDRAAALVGRDDKRTLVLMHNYGSALSALGDYEQAERVLAEVVERRVRVFGEDHPQTVGARSMLASTIQRLGRNQEVVEQFRAILDARRRLFGDEHHATYTAMGNLAVPLIQLGELDEAERLTRTALEGFRAVLPPGHSKILTLMDTRAYLLEDMGRDDEAEALYREQLALRESASGGRDPNTWTSYNNLAMLLQRTGRPGEALELYETLLGLCREHLPAGHIYTALFENNYGACLSALGRYDDARTALERSHAVLVATFPEGHPRITTSLERLGALPTP
ncbi:MAG: hypothetical protein Tsb0013_10430 [Phycisphaerales bacterium]